MKYDEEQSRLWQQIVKQAQDAIIMADREGIIRLWNRGAEKMFGFSPTEALGCSLHLIIPANLRKRHDQGYQRVMASGRSKYTHELLSRKVLMWGRGPGTTGPCPLPPEASFHALRVSRRLRRDCQKFKD